MHSARFSTTAAAPPVPQIGVGEVRHQRRRPVAHGFAYPSFFLLLPLRTLRRTPLAALPRNRFGLISFHDRDHGDGGPDALAWFEQLLAREGLLQEVDGEVWLHCLPRMLGYAFKPVSFWYGHRANGELALIVAEVHNTFGERHSYLLRPDAGATGIRWGQALEARKVFHVSPFCETTGRYRFRFLRNDLTSLPSGATPRTVVRIEYDDHPAAGEGPLLLTSVSGQLQPVSRARLFATFCRMPLMTLGVIVRIHWQALLLWRRRVPFFRKPEPPAAPVSRGTPWPEPGARP